VLVSFERRDNLIQLRNGVRTEDVERRMIQLLPANRRMSVASDARASCLLSCAFRFSCCVSYDFSAVVQKHSQPLARRAGIRRHTFTSPPRK
jgi:hypothetical protein